MARLPAQKMKPGTPVKPSALNKAASAEWDRVLAEFDASGIRISVAHGRLVEQAATIVADMADAREHIDKEGAYHETDKGLLQVHPAAARLDRLRRDYVKVLSLLGLRTPVADGGGERKGFEL